MLQVFVTSYFDSSNFEEFLNLALLAVRNIYPESPSASSYNPKTHYFPISSLFFSLCATLSSLGSCSNSAPILHPHCTVYAHIILLGLDIFDGWQSSCYTKLMFFSSYSILVPNDLPNHCPPYCPLYIGALHINTRVLSLPSVKLTCLICWYPAHSHFSTNTKCNSLFRMSVSILDARVFSF